MPNTTNFNFPTPADTDLVKDGASAIRSLGNSIDTAFVDLKGGTTGQVLSKASNTDLDFSWVAAGTSFSGANVRKASSPGDQTVNNGTWTTITFNSEDFDTNSYHDNTTNTGRLTVGTAGYYIIQGQCQWGASSTTGNRHHRLYKNGATEISYMITTQGSGNLGFSITALVYLAANDYVEFQVYTDGGATSIGWTDGRTFFNITKLG